MQTAFIKHFIFALGLALAFSTPALAAAPTPDEQRAEIQKRKSEVLESLYKIKPKAEQEIKDAAGYAVFSSGDLAAVFLSGSYGHGVAHDNRTGAENYMKMASIGIGLGLGAKNFQTVFIFNTDKAYNNFIKNGLDLSGHVDAAAKGQSKGGALTAAADILPGVRVYQMTESGLLAQVMLKGTRYWRDKELNNRPKSSDARDMQEY